MADKKFDLSIPNLGVPDYVRGVNELPVNYDGTPYSAVPKLSEMQYGNVKPSIYERQPRHILYLGEQIARKVQNNGLLDDDLNQFLAGKTPKDIDKQESEAITAELAMNIASQSAQLDDEKFSSLMEQLQAAMNEQVRPATKPELHRPSDLQLGVAGLAAIFGGGNAFDTLAVPLQYQLAKQAEGLQSDQQRFEQEQANRENRIKLLSTMTDVQSRRDLAQQDANERMLGRQFEAANSELNRQNQAGIAQQNNEYRLALKEMDGEIKSEKSQADKAWDAYYKGKDFETRVNAYNQLIALGYNPGQPPVETVDERYKREQGNKLAAQTQTIDEMRGITKNFVISKTNLNNANADRVSKIAYWMDDLNKVKIAQGYQAIENLQNLMANRNANTSIAERRMINDAWAKSQSSISATLTTISTQANAIRANLRPVERILMETSWDFYEVPQGGRFDAKSGKVFDAKGNVVANPKVKSGFESDREKYEQAKGLFDGYRSSLNDLAAEHQKIREEAKDVRNRLQIPQPKNDGYDEKRNQVSQLRDSFLGAFPGSAYEISAPEGGRNIAGTSTPSLHNFDSAIDLRGGNLSSKAEWATKQPGVQVVIYNRKIWTPGGGWKNYSGGHPHDDHVHVDLGRAGQSSSSKQAQAPSSKKAINVKGIGTVTYRRN